MRHATSAILSAITLCAIPASDVTAQQAELRLTPAEIAATVKGGAGAGTSGVAGIRTTTLSGDPSAAGPYTIEIRVPANTQIAAHAHRDDRSAVVVSGTWFFGYGAKASRAATRALAPGSFYTEPGGKPHFAMTGAEPAVVYITGIGPTSTQYVDSLPPRPRKL